MPRQSALEAGEALSNAGRLDQAADHYRALLESNPDDDVARLHLVKALSNLGDWPGALMCCDQGLAMERGVGELWFTRSEALRRLGRPKEAKESYERLLQIEPSHGLGHQQLGVTLAALGDFEAAILHYDQALVLDPDALKLFNNRGVALEALGRLEAALQSYDRALALDPYYVHALHNKGSVLFRLGRLSKALASFESVLIIRPDIPETLNFCAVVLERLGRHQAALIRAEEALRHRADFPEALNNRSVSLRALGRFEEARRSAEQAIALRGDFAEAYNSLGSALVKLDRLQEAAASYRTSLDLKPGDGAVHLNLGMALELMADLDAAFDQFELARKIDPASPEPIYSGGLVLIRQGNIQEGFKRFEVRWSQKDGPELRYPQDRLWLGQTPAAGRRILVHAEQGFGDVLQFCRFAPLLAERGARVWMEVQPALAPLLSSLKGLEEVIAFTDSPPDFDFHVPVMSLVLALGLSLQELGSPAPYLEPSQALQTLWATRLPLSNRLRVGLAWSGNPKHFNDAHRSMALADLLPGLTADVEFIGLQREYRPADLEIMRDAAIGRYDHQLLDFAHTAALIQRCDVVVAVDTAIAHVAGALGKPLLLMLPKSSDWRWMLDRGDTPWYPSFELIRQEQARDWSGVVARVSQRINGLAQSKCTLIGIGEV